MKLTNLENNLVKLVKLAVPELNYTLNDDGETFDPDRPGVISAFPNENRPEGSYASVNVLTQNKLGSDNVTYKNPLNPNDDLFYKKQGLREITVSFNFYRDNAYDYADKFDGLITSPIVANHLRESNLGYLRSSDLRRLPELVQGSYEERVQIDVTFSAVWTYVSTEFYIAAARIHGIFDQQFSGYETDIEINPPLIPIQHGK